MKCEDCGSPLTTERSAVRRYDIGGLPHVELHGVEVTRCAACGKEEVAIPRMGQLHRMLAECFLRQQRMFAPVEIRFLRKHIGLSMADFAQRMGVTRETVCRWEKGAKPMSTVADRLLRLLVNGHEPTESYAVDDLLRDLNNEPPPTKLSAVPMWNRRDGGWTPRSGPKLAKA